MRLARRSAIDEIQQQVIRLTRAAEDAAFWHNRLLEQAQAAYERAAAAVTAREEQLLVEAAAAARRQEEAATQARLAREAAAETAFHESIATLQAEHLAAVHATRSELYRLTSAAGLSAVEWDGAAWDDWMPPTDADGARCIRIGLLRERVRAAPGDEQALDPLWLPALVPFIGARNLLFLTPAAGRAAAIGAVQSAIVRLLATVPPGKLRFTFVDPRGLGENVAAFLRLSDFDPLLAGPRAWTEPDQIEQRLVELTDHMGDVIQKYLRNEFATIEEFNQNAGEVSQPYHVLVMLDVPSGLHGAALRRLLNLLETGPRCGVYTILTLDPGQPLPDGLKVDDFRRHASTVAWDGASFAWDDEAFRGCSLELDEPPDLALARRWDKTTFGRVLTAVGKESRESSRVEVAFRRVLALFREQIAADPVAYSGILLPVEPDAPKSWWRADATHELVVPLGRAGASRVQCLRLGRGTAHHALIAGRTGSGKSTLLHVIITGLALTYSPDQLELYLVDFKKGVEFKTYATRRLPHASVVAIGSDRAFGLSVLQGLDAELRRRGELFRSAHTSDLTAFRHSSSSALLPRIVLVLDEFQELFVADDEIADGATQALDRLARQGRAFGMHLLLATQSLAGAFDGARALARSTVAQMQVRIALPCDEIDSRLILAENNAAARTLTRPGAAIYNALAGAPEGNDPLQVAWLPVAERDIYLDRIRALAHQRGLPPRAQRVFEGSRTTWISTPWDAPILEEPIEAADEGFWSAAS